jgi:hypothetical protein
MAKQELSAGGVVILGTGLAGLATSLNQWRTSI